MDLIPRPSWTMEIRASRYRMLWFVWETVWLRLAITGEVPNSWPRDFSLFISRRQC